MRKKIAVSISGLPGKMSSLLANGFNDNERFRENFTICSQSMTGAEVAPGNFGLGETGLIELCPGAIPLAFNILNKGHRLLAVDATVPAAVNRNAEIYCQYNVPFVMLTTGGNRKKLEKTVRDSEIPAVIATNMSVPIVMLMDMFQYAAAKYPDVLKDYYLGITESHQFGKKDKSGTAKTIAELLKTLGANYGGEESINDIRDSNRQVLMGIPPNHLRGHGWHKYELLSPGQDVQLKFEHNINGRQTYVDGTLLALEFLAKKVKEGARGEVYSMTDVLIGK